MQTVADLLADAADHEGPAFATDRAADHTYAETVATVWKAGNLMRHYGVRAGERVAVAIGPKDPGAEDEPGWLGPEPTPVVALLGAMADGAVVDPDPPAAVDATALVTPAAWLDRYQGGPGTTAVAYGGPPEDPAVAHFEKESWSENPTRPPAEVGPGDAALATRALYSHGDLLAASRRVLAETDLEAGDEVVPRAPLGSAGALVAAVLAPMRVGATVVLDREATGTVAVGGDDPPESRVVDPADATPP